MKRLALVAALLAAACTEEVSLGDGPWWVDDTPYPGIGDGKILVTNSGDDTVTWLDLSSMAPVWTGPVGRLPPEREGPHHGAVLPDASAFFVGISNFVPGSGTGPHGSHGTGSVRGYLLKYGTADHSLIGETLVDRSPGDVRLTLDGATVLQSHFDLLKIQEAAMAGGDYDDMRSALYLIDAQTMERIADVPVCPAPHGIAPAPDRVWLACYASDELAEVSLADHAVTRHHVGPGVIDPTSTPSYGPYAVSVREADGTVWVSTLEGAAVRVFDPATGAFTEIPVGGAAFFGAFTCEGDRYVVPVQGQNLLAFIDAAARTVAQTLPLPQEACEAPHAVMVHPDCERLLVVCEGDHVGPGSVAIIAPLAAPSVQAFHPVGVFPDDAVLIEGGP
jgi:hypothetical protein